MSTCRYGPVKIFVLLLCLLGSLFLAPIAPASAATILLSFGEDLNETTTPLATTPHATAARTNFLAGLSDVDVETFEALSLGHLASPVALTFGTSGITGTLTPGAGALQVQQQDATAFGIYPTSGTQFLSWGPTTDPNMDFQVNFSSPVQAFGFFGIGAGDFHEHLQLTVGLLHGGSQIVEIPHALDNNAFGAVFFAGLVMQDDAFTSIIFKNSNTGGGVREIALDDFTTATAVPEPASIVLLGTGIVGLLARKRLRARL